MPQSDCRASAPLAIVAAGDAPALQKCPREIHRTAEQVQILRAGDLQGPELFQMGGHPLSIEKRKPTLPKAFHEGKESDF